MTGTSDEETPALLERRLATLREAVGRHIGECDSSWSAQDLSDALFSIELGIMEPPPQTRGVGPAALVHAADRVLVALATLWAAECRLCDSDFSHKQGCVLGELAALLAALKGDSE
jgi:hypothetical protein